MKRFKPVIRFYAVASLLIIISNQLVPSDSCNPGLGIIAFLLLIPISAVLAIYNLAKAYKYKSGLFTAIFHAITLMTLMVLVRHL